MPEGPSIVILKEAISGFKGKKVISVSGDTKAGKERLLNQKITDINSWGKHLLICFKNFTVRIHLMLFGSYRINESRERKPRLGMKFSEGELNFYNCSVKIIEERLENVYDWSGDVLNEAWNPMKAFRKLNNRPELLVCDALMDQQIFSGVGNIIKNEVLFRIMLHPQSEIGSVPTKKIKEMIREARTYSFDFLRWKKDFELKKHWLIYNKKICPRCKIPTERKNLGRTNRRSFYCNNCQTLYETSSL